MKGVGYRKAGPIHLASVEAKMTEFMKAWQCVGCDRIEAPQPCIGVCQDRKVQFVYAGEYEEALEHTRLVGQKADILMASPRQLALTNPHDGEWEKCYRAMQKWGAARIGTAGSR